MTIYPFFNLNIKYKRKINNIRMQQLISYLFNRYITSIPSCLSTQLCSLQIVTLPTLKPSQQQLHLIQYLLAKNIINYSPTQFTIKLNIQMVLTYQRIHKLRLFCQEQVNSHFGQLLDKFISNEFLPVNFSQKGIRAITGAKEKKVEKDKQEKEVKSKKKKQIQPQKVQEIVEVQEEEPTRLFYQYSGKGNSAEYMVNIDEITSQLKWFKVQKHLGKDRAHDMAKQIGDGQKPIFIDMHDAAREKTPRTEIVKKIMTKVREEKVEEFILQLFRRYDEEGTQRCSSNCLLMFNLVKRNPLIGQKDLSVLSLLPLVAQRKCLNLLVQEGLIHYYPQSARCYLYRIREYDQIESLFIERVCQSALNLHILMSEITLSKDQLLKFQAMLWDIDDILLLFSE